MRIFRCFIWLLVFLGPCFASASHIRGGEITIKQIQCGSFEYEVTLTIYTDISSSSKAGGGILLFGDGAFITLPELTNTIVDANFNVGKAIFKITHNFGKAGQYVVSYLERNRNGGILNILNSFAVPFYIETQLNILAGVCNNPLSFSVLPIDRACRGISFSHNPGVVDIDGDSVSYEIFVPEKEDGKVVDGFLLPNDKGFYTGIDYQKANEKQTGLPVFQIDNSTGLLIWDAPGAIGQYAIALKVVEWRKIGDKWVKLGYTVRDMQIIVEDCKNARPFMKLPKDICVKPGNSISEIIRGFDMDYDQVKIEVFTVDNFFSSPPIFINKDKFQSTSPGSDTASIKFKWNITCELVRDQPYKIIFKITDKPINGIRLSFFATWSISVIGDAPKYRLLELNLAAKTLKVEWEPYPCENAKTIEIWRRVDRFQYTQNDCSRGIPRSLGFEKIGSVTGSTIYVDKDLNPGAQYCYRLVALYEYPNRSFSLAAADTCIGPIVVDAPVVTNVSVNKTDSLKGEILIRWTAPFEIDKLQFPPPYEYELYRVNANKNFTKVMDHRISDTTYVDNNLNTTDELYGYKIVVYSPKGLSKENPLDTSATAFYPRLEPESRKNGIYLSWNAVVPWSNQSQRFPWHYIYRSEEGSKFVLIDSVNNSTLTDKEFNYLDEGKYKSVILSDNIVYQYMISTNGTYGNPKLKEPLINFSNEVVAQPIDKSPPCKPLLSIVNLVCEDFIQTSVCDFNEFKNTLNWSYPNSCGNDVAYYKILYLNSYDEEFKFLATTVNLSFVHRKQKSFAGCYKIIAVDHSGNVGVESEIICIENCPNIFIPNVITPSNQDGLNDTFPGIVKAGDKTEDFSKCPRFVTTIDIKIFNLWGQQVYALNSQSQELGVEWSGVDSNGKELPSGTYYYTANVYFDVMNPELQHQKMKGWIQLIR